MAQFKPFALLFKPVVLCVGFIYPAYASYKALESKSPVAHAQWLTYWVVFSLFTVVEYFADFVISWIPFYYLAKLAFVLWLQLPRFQGATKVSQCRRELPHQTTDDTWSGPAMGSKGWPLDVV